MRIVITLFFISICASISAQILNYPEYNCDTSVKPDDLHSWCHDSQDDYYDECECRFEKAMEVYESEKKRLEDRISSLYSEKDQFSNQSDQQRGVGHQYWNKLSEEDNPNFESDKEKALSALLKAKSSLEQAIAVQQEIYSLQEKKGAFSVNKNGLSPMQKDLENLESTINSVRNTEPRTTSYISNSDTSGSISNDRNQDSEEENYNSSLGNNSDSHDGNSDTSPNNSINYSGTKEKKEERTKKIEEQKRKQYEANEKLINYSEKQLQQSYNRSKEGAKTFFSNLAQWESRKDYEFIKRKKKANRLFVKLRGLLINDKFEKARRVGEELGSSELINTLGPTEEVDYNTLLALAYLGDPDFTVAPIIEKGSHVAKKALYRIDLPTQKLYEDKVADLWNTTIIDSENENFDRVLNNYYKLYWLTGEPAILAMTLIVYSKLEDWKNYENVLKELKKINKDIIFTQYFIEDKRKGKMFFFDSSSQSRFLKMKRYSNPSVIKTTIISAKKVSEELNTVQENIMIAEAEEYYKQGNIKQAIEVFKKKLKKNPNDAETIYNIGVMHAEIGDNKKAIEYYEKAIEVDNDLNSARINIVVTILSKEREIIEELNNLGKSKADNERNKELEEDRMEVYKEVIPYLEDAIEHDPSNVEIIRTAMNIFYALDEEDKAQVMKERLEELQQ